eukprot:14207422-Heterocapsa_arctica.AAC.1
MADCDLLFEGRVVCHLPVVLRAEVNGHVEIRGRLHGHVHLCVTTAVVIAFPFAECTDGMPRLWLHL